MGDKTTLFPVPSRTATDFYLRNLDSLLSPIYSRSPQTIPFRKLTVAFRLAAREMHPSEFVIPGVGVLQFRNKNPFEVDYTFEVYVHERSLFFERPTLFRLSRSSRLQTVPARKVVRNF